MKNFYTIIFILSAIVANAQISKKDISIKHSEDLNYYENKITAGVNTAIVNNYNSHKQYFDNAYVLYPQVPRGILEAVSFTMTRFYHVDSTGEESCIGLPRVYGVMGLTLNGKNYFRNNLITVSEKSGISINEIINNPEKNIKAYAAAYVAIKNQLEITSMKIEDQVPVLIELSELPLTNDIQNNFALNSHLYSVMTFLSNKYYSNLCGFPEYSIDMKNIFGEDNFRILNSGHVIIRDTTITNSSGQKFINNHMHSSLSPNSTDYGPALWNAAATCNYTPGRGGTAVSAVVVHDVEGTYAGCISWFQNCSAVVSAHYVLRSSDGQITQMVSEADKAWHVGSENPYTIGMEHEGYVAQTGWYTTAMYGTSADLVRDICNSGYGISPLRTGFWPWMGTTYYNVSSIPGSCTKIKGHQHYPNQTHNDPGPNWDWDYYYKLINNNPAITTLTTTTGNLYDTGGLSGNYSNDERDVWVISPTGASTVTLNFASFSTEDTWDYMYIYDGNSVWSPLIGYYTGTTSPGTITSTGGSLTVEFRSDCATAAAGWDASWTSTVADNVPPTTSIASVGTWKTHDFTATFTDADNVGGSGLEKSFYQVLEYNNGLWGANASQGFFADNFDTLQTSIWTVPPASGTWSVNGGLLVQSDTAVGNSNIYASLNQELSNRYLYQFSAKVGTGTYSGNQRRFGFHFFCDTANTLNRNNSYFIFFRVETSQLEFYKVVNDVFTQEKIVTGVTTNANQLYDYKVFYDRITGLIAVYRDNIFLGSWTDPAPYSTGGNYVSFRTGNSHLWVDELKVFRSRLSSVNITVGAAATNYIRSQNPNPSTYGAKIKSICNDVAGNISTIAYHDLNVDYTPPSTIAIVNDGTGTDVDTISSITDLSANWTSSTDPNSDISLYKYAIGTTPGDSNFIPWTANALSTSINLTGLSMTPGATYYVSVRAVNGAGLVSLTSTSDGQFVAPAPNASFTASNTIICPGDTVNYSSTSTNANSYQWQFTGGTPAVSTLQNPAVVYDSSGTYDVSLTVSGIGGSDTLIQNGYILVHPNAVAGFNALDTLIELTMGYAYFTNNSTDATTYFWNFDDGTTSTDANPWHQYTAIGYYTVTLIAYSSYCGSDTIVLTNYIHVVNTIGINEISDNFHLTISPNPFNNQSVISYILNEDQNIRISLTDILGKQIVLKDEKQSAGSHQIKIDANKQNLSNGLYLLELRGLNAKTTIKLIIY